MLELNMLPTGCQGHSESAPERLGMPHEPPRQPQEVSGGLQDAAKSLPRALLQPPQTTKRTPRGPQIASSRSPKQVF